jgi:hypothetical protein
MTNNEINNLDYASKDKDRPSSLRNCGLVSLWSFSVACALFAICVIAGQNVATDEQAGFTAAIVVPIGIGFVLALSIGLIAGLVGILGHSADRTRSKIGLILNAVALTICCAWFVIAIRSK